MTERRCDVCRTASDEYTYAPTGCPCTDVQIVWQTIRFENNDGSVGTTTEPNILCLECRMTYAAWGDTIRIYSEGYRP